jgi:hypothetical protein
MGCLAKSKARLDRLYRDYDEEFPQSDMVAHQFSSVMEAIDTHYGDLIRRSVYSREVHFFTLFMYTYDALFDLSSETFRRRPRSLPRGYRVGLTEASRRFKELEVPQKVLDAVARASADFGRRRTRFQYLREVVESASA